MLKKKHFSFFHQTFFIVADSKIVEQRALKNVTVV